jgi:hypothetical protein
LCPSGRPFDNGLLPDGREIRPACGLDQPGAFPIAGQIAAPNLARLPGAGQKARARLDFAAFDKPGNAQKLIREMIRAMI